MLTDISRVRLIPLKTHTDPRGNLTAIEGESDLPFSIQRLFYVYGVTSGDERAGHAHPDTEQCLIAIHGALDVNVRSPQDERSFHLDDPRTGLYVPPMLWVRLYNFTPGAVCLAAASTHYEPERVLRDWGEYTRRMSETAGQ